MLNPEQIRAMNRRTAAKVAQDRMVPFLVESEDIADFREGCRFPFPTLGGHVPHGWQKVQDHFLDGPLTASEFIARLVVGRGYAVIEVGDYHVCVGEYISTPRNGHRGAARERLWARFNPKEV